ncbi:Cyanovirin-N [Ceratobasidium sp. AG-I]|nr:Cyanovirin-N [Ceratobasidium sp. AG-I]
MQSASIDLDEYIGNYDGWFEWQGVGFSQSASDVTLTMGEDGNTPTLEAMLAKADGEFRERQGIQLGDRIGNIDGKFEFVEG